MSQAVSLSLTYVIRTRKKLWWFLAIGVSDCGKTQPRIDYSAVMSPSFIGLQQKQAQTQIRNVVRFSRSMGGGPQNIFAEAPAHGGDARRWGVVTRCGFCL